MSSKPTIYIGADHAGYKMKEALEEHLQEQGYTVEDMGNETLDKADDYPKFSYNVARNVSTDDNALGIVLCGNAQGVCIVANKVKGVRAATGFDEEEVKTTRTDDNSNILCLPARFLSKEKAKSITQIWLNTPFSEAERHKRRLKQVENIENQTFK